MGAKEDEAVIDPSLEKAMKATPWQDYDGNGMSLAIALHTVLGNMSLPTMVSSDMTTHVKPQFKRADASSILEGNLQLDEALATFGQPIKKSRAEDILKSARAIFNPGDKVGNWCCGTIEKQQGSSTLTSMTTR